MTETSLLREKQQSNFLGELHHDKVQNPSSESTARTRCAQYAMPLYIYIWHSNIALFISLHEDLRSAVSDLTSIEEFRVRGRLGVSRIALSYIPILQALATPMSD